MRIVQAFAAFSVLGLAACGAPAASPDSPAQVTEAVTEETRLVAALSYADWCGSCKVLDPKLAAIRTGEPIDGVAHVVLDFTEKDEVAYFAAADEAGIGEAVRAYYDEGVGTGLLLLVDLDDGEVVSVVRKDMTEADIRAALETAAAAA